MFRIKIIAGDGCYSYIEVPHLADFVTTPITFKDLRPMVERVDARKPTLKKGKRSYIKSGQEGKTYVYKEVKNV